MQLYLSYNKELHCYCCFSSKVEGELAEDFAHSGCRIQKIQAGSNLKLSFLWSNFRSTRNYCAICPGKEAINSFICLSYFPISQVRYHSQENIKYCGSMWDLQFQRLSTHEHHDRD